MIVPEYWAEAKEEVRINGSRRTLKRFGWSDVSEQDARENARERVRDAAARARAGESVRAADHKVAYNGAEGLPIREEIIERHGDAVITRNSYGALCLNTPNVLFADVDVAESRHTGAAFVIFAAIMAAGFWIRSELCSWSPVVIAFFLGAFVSGPLAATFAKLTARFREDPFDTALARIRAYVDANRDWSLRVYRTPMGYRVLAMHETFDPEQEAAFKFMKAIQSDPLYMRMCRNQKCFRARLTPKPWRIDMERLRPRPGVWPIKREHMDRRRRWVAEYERKSGAYAACRFVDTLGSGRASRECERVKVLHDRYCRAESSSPLA